MKKTKKKLRWLQFFSFFGLLAPIVTIVAVNAESYFSVQPGMTKVIPQYVEVGMGAILAGVGGGLLLLGKTQPLKGSRGLLFGLLLAVLLKAIIGDLILILGGLTVGSLIHSAFKPAIETTKQILKYEEQAKIQADALGNVMKAQKKEERIDGNV